MRRHPRTLVVVGVAVIVVGQGAKWLWPEPSPSRPPVASRALTVGEADRSAGLRFAAEVTPADRRLVLSTIAGARPEARRLIAVVDGVTTVRVQATGPSEAGHAVLRRGDYEVVLDLAPAYQRFGQRGVSRLVLHELAHVIDHALVPPGLAARLDAAVPRGWETGSGATGSSASRNERFAESFAKWATGDIGVDLSLGYAVPPPPLDWGAPLTAL